MRLLATTTSLFILFAIIGCNMKNSYKLENDFLSRTILVQDGIICTSEIINKLNGEILTPILCDEFKLRISEGTDKVGTDTILTAQDFQFVSGKHYEKDKVKGVLLNLKNKELGLTVIVHYELESEASYMNKYITVGTEKVLTIERIDVESISFSDAYQPYKLKAITSYGMYPPNWKPGLGQPLYTKESATFWGIEFPAATNFVKDSVLNCGYLWGKEIDAGSTYKSYESVVGVADKYEFIDAAFYNYIDQIRKRPLRLQVQYNSWFDFRNKVTKTSFLESVDIVHEELVEKRNCKPLNAYVIDDGWQDSFSDSSNWQDDVWKINQKFDPGLNGSQKHVESLNSKLGLWLSPGCFFGAKNMVQKLGKQGYESLTLSMSMAGPKYMDKLEERIAEFCEQGIAYFKFDGLFGHLYIRDYELNGRGSPEMPQLDTEGFTANDKRLNDTKYDELKTYYLVAGTERLIQVFDRMALINPEVFITISNGAYLSPWWLQYVDVVWLINAGDAAKGSKRTDELVYRDGVYYEIWKTENTKFPMSAIFNHEPKKIKAEDTDEFRRYLYMNLSRGTGFVELYLITKNLVDEDWDVIAEGLRWTYQVFPTFNRVNMHGGDPRKREVYGFTAWNKDQGYISIHNPSDRLQTYTICLDRKLGIIENNNLYHLSSPLEGDTFGLEKSYNYGETLSIILKPKDIRILNFSVNAIDWHKQFEKGRTHYNN